MRAVHQRVPLLGPLLAMQWAAMRLRLWLQDADRGGWHVLYIYGSLLQGGLDGHPVFCIVIGVMLVRVSSDDRIRPSWTMVKVWLYVDDIVFQCPIALLQLLLQVLADAMRPLNFELQRRKCRVHVPALAARPLEQWPPEAQALQELLPVSPEGITILGTEGAGEHALPLGPWAEAAAETRARAAKACKLADAALELIRRPPPAGGKQVAWRICRNIITHAMDYDSRVLTSSLVLPHASVVEARAWEILEAVVGVPLTDQQRVQIQLPTQLSGCQMPMPTGMLPAARAAALIEVGPHVRQAVSEWGFGIETAKSVDGVGEAVAKGLHTSLAEQRVGFEQPGRAVLASAGDAPATSADLLRPPAPSRHTMSAILLVIAEARHKQLLLTDVARDRTRVYSAGGPNAGKALVAPAGLKEAQFADEEFTEILRWRLGIPAQPEAALCQNVAATGVTCEEVMGPHCDHAMACATGPLRIRRHDDIADCLADIIDECGAHVRREAYMRCFSTAAGDAWLDVWAFGGLHVPELVLDITVRHPVVGRYQPGASQRPGAAAAIAEEDKQTRYPPNGGRKVTAFSVETWGRLGESAEELLRLLAEKATLRARRRGQVVVAGSFLRRWRAMLDGCLQRGVAAALLSAKHGLPGKPHKRR